ncbi:MAG: nuclear transport factor 2 family protein [Pseudooceanicola sp.]|nr:nuclear transport factor 2 family protein [Pseudooceanicola sp.]
MGERLSAEERLDIQELFARYCWGLNTGDAEQVLSCFTADGALIHPPQGRCAGEANIRALLDELWYGRPSWFVGRQHLASQFLYERAEGGARVRAYWTITQKCVDSGRTYIYALGHWNNLCAVENGEWKFRELDVMIWNRDTVPWKGEARAIFQPTVGRA